MTNDGLGRVMGYDAANRLVSVGRTVQSVTTNSILAYDPAGRLHRFAVAGGATTNFLYDGSQAIAEYDNAATPALLRRYVPGAAPDETLVWYEGSGTADRRFLMTDPRGSVVAIANSSGTVTDINKYDEYGAPAAGNVGRFQFTGQIWLEEAGLYHYKARGYHPELGRFLQTDPIGYGDGMNMYAYVGGDPVNFTDPSGMAPDDEVVVTGTRLKSQNPNEPAGGFALDVLSGGGPAAAHGGGLGGWRGFAPPRPKPVDEILVIGVRPSHHYAISGDLFGFFLIAETYMTTPADQGPEGSDCMGEVPIGPNQTRNYPAFSTKYSTVRIITRTPNFVVAEPHYISPTGGLGIVAEVYYGIKGYGGRRLNRVVTSVGTVAMATLEYTVDIGVPGDVYITLNGGPATPEGTTVEVCR